MSPEANGGPMKIAVLGAQFEVLPEKGTQATPRQLTRGGDHRGLA